MEPASFDFTQLLASLLPFLVFGLVIYVYFSICLMIIANKTGTPGAILAWIPVLNLYLMVRIAGRPGYWLIPLLIPILGLPFFIVLWMDFSRKRGRPSWLGLLMVVPPINLIIPALLAAGGNAQSRTNESGLGAKTPEPDFSPPAESYQSSSRQTLCPDCGSRITPEDAFCGECGADLADLQAASVQGEYAAGFGGQTAGSPVGHVRPEKASGRGSLIAGVVVIGLIAVIGLVVLAWMFLGGSSISGQPPELPGRLAGTLTEFPVDTDAAKPVRPGSVISQNFEGGKGNHEVSIPEDWLPPGLPPSSLPGQSEAITSTTYRNSPSDPPVNVHVVETSSAASNVVINISIEVARSTGGEQSGVRVESPQGGIYEGTRIQSGQHLVYILAKQLANIVIIIFAPDPSVRDVATRLAGNVSNGQGLNDYSEVRDSIWTLPPAAPANLTLREIGSFAPDDLGMAELEGAANDSGPLAAEIRGVIDQVKVLIPPRLVAIRYEDDAGQEWGVLLGDYRSAFKSWAAWLMLSTLMSGESESVAVGSESGALLNQSEGPLLVFRRQGVIVGIQAPPGAATNQLLDLGLLF